MPAQADTRDTGAPVLVSLVGAGPGAPDLITLRGLERLRAADVVVYDDLVDTRLLSEAPEGAELVYAGKRGWRDGPERPDTGELLVRKVREAGGRRVVRLKGGDPMVFGRGGEEVAALAEAGVPFEVVPGVTAATAAAAASGVPLTLRGVSSAVTLVTASAALRDGGTGPAMTGLAALALAGSTLAVYMGLRGLGEFAAALVACGVPADTPASLVAGASTASEQVVTGTLADIAALAEEAAVTSPALVLVGAVVGHAALLRRAVDQTRTG